MPYIIRTLTTDAAQTGDVPNCDDYTHAGSRAVATLDEAQEIVREAIERTHVGPLTVGRTEDVEADALTMAYHDALNANANGGTIGPLPDGSVVEVREVRWYELAEATGYSVEATRWPKTCGKIIDAYNSRDERVEA